MSGGPDKRLHPRRGGQKKYLFRSTLHLINRPQPPVSNPAMIQPTRWTAIPKPAGALLTTATATGGRWICKNRRKFPPAELFGNRRGSLINIGSKVLWMATPGKHWWKKRAAARARGLTSRSFHPFRRDTCAQL